MQIDTVYRHVGLTYRGGILFRYNQGKILKPGEVIFSKSPNSENHKMIDLKTIRTNERSTLILQYQIDTQWLPSPLPCGMDSVPKPN